MDFTRRKMKIKLTRKHFVELDKIDKFKLVKGQIWVYLKDFYFAIIKSEYTLDALKLQLLNKSINPNLFIKE